MEHGGRRLGCGRKPGIPNKLSGNVKAMVVQAINDLGGADYFRRQGEKTPEAFMRLASKLIPTEVGLTGPGGSPLQIQVVHYLRPALQKAPEVPQILPAVDGEMKQLETSPDHASEKCQPAGRTPKGRAK
jgi:hypothetical protein